MSSGYDHFQCGTCDSSFTEYHDSFECALCEDHICEKCAYAFTKQVKTKKGETVMICLTCFRPPDRKIRQSDKIKMLDYVMEMYKLDWDVIYEKVTGIQTGKSKYEHFKKINGWTSEGDNSGDDNSESTE
jgi:hypothetical protein